MTKLNAFISTPQKFWLLISAILILFFWVFSSSLMPFLIGFVLAYILTPLADFLERKGMNRMIATNIVIIAFITAISLFGLLFIPLIFQQASDLIANSENYAEKIINYASAKISQSSIANYWLEDAQNFEILPLIKSVIKENLGFTKNIVESLVSKSVGVVKFATSFIIMFIAAFYLILDWHKLIAQIDSWLPRHHHETITRLVKKVDYLQSSYIRGQILVCIIMATYYIISFWVMDLKYGFVLGLTTGILTFIPYVGASLGFLLTISIAIAQYLPETYPLLVIAMIFAIGQTIEGYILVPQLVGGAVDLHPAWIMFALLAFGSLLGISGMLIAVPVTASIGVLTNFALERYMLSEYYHGSTKY